MILIHSLSNSKSPAVVPHPPLLPKGTVPPETAVTLSAEEVAKRAYLNYVRGGSLQGHDVENWLEAEKQLLTELSHDMSNEYQGRS